MTSLQAAFTEGIVDELVGIRLQGERTAMSRLEQWDNQRTVRYTGFKLRDPTLCEPRGKMTSINIHCLEKGAIVARKPNKIHSGMAKEQTETQLDKQKDKQKGVERRIDI